MTWSFKLLGFISCASLLAACVSTGGPNVSNKDAAVANVQLGVAYMQQGNLLLAREKLERAEKQDPRNVELHTALAYLSERLGKPADAERHYQTAQRLAPESAAVANNYAVFLCQSKKVDQALKLFETAARDPLYRTPWAAWTNAAVCLRSGKRGSEAIPYLEKAISQQPNYAPAVIELGDLHLEAGKPDLATNVVDRYLSMGLNSPEVLLIGLRSAIARGDRQTTDSYARRLRRDFPNSSQTRSLAQLLRNTG
jgi:type IV pilus assembly protein PilF